jgi:hypothetical protein
MLQKLGDHIANCLKRAEEAERGADSAETPLAREQFAEMAKHWRRIAASYEFLESMERFLIDSHNERTMWGTKPPAPPSK